MHAPGCKVQFLDIPSMSSIHAGSQVCWILLLKTLAYSTKTRPGHHGRFQKKSWYILLRAGSCLHSATQSRTKMHAGLVEQVILHKNKTNKENGGNCREPFLLLGRVPFPGLASAMGCLKPLTSWKQGAPSVSIGRQLNRWNRLQILLKLTDLACPYRLQGSILPKKETFKKWLAAVQSVAIRTRHQNRTVEQSWRTSILLNHIAWHVYKI